MTTGERRAPTCIAQRSDGRTGIEEQTFPEQAQPREREDERAEARGELREQRVLERNINNDFVRFRARHFSSVCQTILSRREAKFREHARMSRLLSDDVTSERRTLWSYLRRPCSR